MCSAVRSAEVVIQFNPVMYSGEEGGSVTFIIELTGATISSDVSFNFATADGTAQGS